MSLGAKVGVEYLEPERNPGMHALPCISRRAKAKAEIHACTANQGAR